MANYYSPISVNIRNTHVYCECEYEPIHIKWDTGYMDIVAPALFTDAGLAKIRKVFRMSAESDLMYDTNTLSAWRKAFKTERDYQFKVLSVIQDEYDAAYKEIVDSAVKPDSDRGKKLRLLNKRKSQSIKQLDTRKKNVQRYAEILEEVAERYSKGVSNG